MRLIDADALINEFNEAQIEFDEYYKGLGKAKAITDNAPTVQEPKTDILDKIRAEIEQTADEERKHDEKWAIGLRYAVKIIDKYNQEGEE